jgi:hypothetical protein
MRLPFLLLLLTTVLSFSGCSTNKEDQAFFERGWIKPDKAADERMYGAKAPDGDMEVRPVPQQR